MIKSDEDHVFFVASSGMIRMSKPGKNHSIFVGERAGNKIYLDHEDERSISVLSYNNLLERGDKQMTREEFALFLITNDYG